MNIFLHFKNLKLPKPSIAVGLIMIAVTQIPLTINESLKLVCITTTWADYAAFWDWRDVPLDSRVRYCLGSTNPNDDVRTIPKYKTMDSD